MGLFGGLLIAFDLGYNLKFSKKTEVKRKVLENGGTVSFIVTKKCNFVVSSDPKKCDVSSKCRMAIKYGLPVLKLDYIWDSLQANLLLPYDLYVVGGKSKTLDFKSGKISASLHSTNTKKLISKPVFNPKTVKLVATSDCNQPWCHEDNHEVAKYAVFSGYIPNMKCQCLTIIELHTPPATSSEKSHSKFNADKNQREAQLNYRVMIQTGRNKDLEAGKTCHTEVRYVSTADQALAVFAMLYENTMKKADMTKLTGPVRAVGSLKFQKLMAEMVDVHSHCDDEVKELVEHIWNEVMTEVTSVLGDISAIKIEQVDKAEAILVKVRDAIKSGSDENVIQELISEFYSTLQHKNETSQVDVDYRRWVSKKQDMCQLIRDVLSVSEMTYYETRAYVEAKYAALRCKITHLTGDQRDKIEEFVKSSLESPSQDLTVLNVYEVWRQVEDLNFRHDLDGKQLLFHSSKVENFVGILSRGLLLPKVVVDDFGGKRSDAGMLGSGIYFASSASTSVKYSSPSKIKGSRLLLINEVALGHIKDYTTHDTTLVAPPDSYNSTHGVSKKTENTSVFENDEFVVYSVDQQRVRYLVEFTVKGDKTRSLEKMDSADTNVLFDAIEATNISDVKGITDPLSKVIPGLISSNNDVEVELRGVHIRAKLIDLASQVVVLQEYCNNSQQAIEAKYVFPLEDTAAVCGFEAFINGKHIVGEVKEKETAHKEYKKAISEGHGAYLMDQDEETPDIFTVSVGNLPPGASVLIKITYVAELQTEEEQISFVLPATVVPWKEESALKHPTQTELRSHQVGAPKTTIQVAVEMPFEIRNLYSPTHKIRIKQTASKAFVEMARHEKFGSGFQLLISLAEIHVPRMWVESHSVNKDHRACMLTFYPEFESTEVTDGEVILILDTSNSMKGAPLSEAKKVALLVLQNLPSSWFFNLIRFGSDYEELFPAPKLNAEESLQHATDFIQNSVANKGNTGIMQPLRTLFLLPRGEVQRNVFLISDGHINDEEHVLRCASQNSAHTRVFSFGVRATCNSYLLKALSRVSGGAFEFFNSKTKSKWEPKVRNQISKARQPGLTSVSVEWQQYDDNLPSPVQAPQQITALFNGSRQVVYGFVPNCIMATLKANIEGQDVSTLVSTSELSITEGLLVHRLTARAIIRDWEDGVLSRDRTKHEVAKMDLKNYIIDLSKEYSMVTQFTSFIAVEKREENEKDLQKTGPTIQELVQKENVDILSYMGWTKEPEYKDDDSSEIFQLTAVLTKERDLDCLRRLKFEGAMKKHVKKKITDVHLNYGCFQEHPPVYIPTEVPESSSLDYDHRDEERMHLLNLTNNMTSKIMSAETELKSSKDRVRNRIREKKKSQATFSVMNAESMVLAPDEDALLESQKFYSQLQHSKSSETERPHYEDKEGRFEDELYDLPLEEPTTPPEKSFSSEAVLTDLPVVTYTPSESTYSPTSPSYKCMPTLLASQPDHKILPLSLLCMDMDIDEPLNEQHNNLETVQTPSQAHSPAERQLVSRHDIMDSFSLRRTEKLNLKASDFAKNVQMAKHPSLLLPLSNSSYCSSSSYSGGASYTTSSHIDEPLHSQNVKLASDSGFLMRDCPPLHLTAKESCAVTYSDVAELKEAARPASLRFSKKVQPLPNESSKGATFSSFYGLDAPKTVVPQRIKHSYARKSFRGEAILFGSTTPASSATPETSALFGSTTPASSATPETGALFGSTTPASSATPETGALFGSTTPASSATSETGALFGSTTPASIITPETSALFGNTTLASSATPEIGALFGSTTPASITNLDKQKLKSNFCAIPDLPSFYLGEPRSLTSNDSRGGRRARACFLQQNVSRTMMKRSSAPESSLTMKALNEQHIDFLGESMPSSGKVHELSKVRAISTITCIKKREGYLSLKALDDLLECQNKNGYWELQISLDDLLGINSAECLEILLSSGLRSLGNSTSKDIERLVATILVLFSIIELILPEYFPIGGPSSKDFPETLNFRDVAFKFWNADSMKHSGDDIVDSVRNALEFCVKMERQYPLVYSTLNLGKSWINVAANFMQP